MPPWSLPHKQLLAFTVAKKRWLVCQKSFTSEKYATRQTPIDKIGVRDHRRNCLVPYSAPGKPLPAPRLERLRQAADRARLRTGNCLGDALTRFDDALLDHGVHETLSNSQSAASRKSPTSGPIPENPWTSFNSSARRESARCAALRCSCAVCILPCLNAEIKNRRRTCSRRTQFPRALEISRGSVETIQRILDRRKGLVELDLPAEPCQSPCASLPSVVILP